MMRRSSAWLLVLSCLTISGLAWGSMGRAFAGGEAVGAVAPGAAQEGDEAPVLERFEYRQVHMGVEARLVLYAKGRAEADFAAMRAYSRLGELEASWSNYRPDSELARLVVRAGHGPVEVSNDLLRIVSLARGLAQVSEGAYDPTGAPLYGLWAQARIRGTPPSEAEIQEARARVGYQRIHLDLQKSTIALDEGTELDLSAIGKGMAADELIELLRNVGAPAALVEIGGDLALGEPPPGRRGWKVAAGSGQAGGKDELLELCRCGIATSGDREQHLDQEGRRLSHILDPRTGRPVEGGVTVTVLAETGAQADALATACSVLERSAAEALVDRFPGAEVFFEAPPGGDTSGWRSIFDGQTLEGWVTRGGRYDGPAPWSVEDGVLVGRTTESGEGGLIYTQEQFSCFEIEFDCKLDYPFDSGLFVRMLPPDYAPEAAAAHLADWPADKLPRKNLKGAQITLDHRPGGEIAAIYADGFLEHNEAAEAHFNKDQWNRVRVRVTGFDFRIETWINDQPVGDYRLPANSPGYAPFGRIGLQVHPADPALKDQTVRFKNLRLRELPNFEPADWRDWSDPLAGGLAGLEFHGGSAGYELEDGVLAIPADGGGEVFTRESHRDFRLRVEFRIARMANSGLYLRSDPEGENPSYQGLEVQILDDYHWEAETRSTLLPYQKTGGLYGVMPPGPAKHLRPLSEWNLYEVLCSGDRLAVALNGQTLYDLDLSVLPAEPPMSKRPQSGFIGFQRYGAPNVILPWAVQVRNWRIQDLPPSER